MITDLGIRDYEEAYLLQMEMVALRKLKEIGDSLILAEHNAVITIGRSGVKAKDNNLLVQEDLLGEYGIKVLDVDRGGDITLHAPGQLVVYPIVDLKEKIKDLHLYMQNLENSIIDCLSRFDIRVMSVPKRTGVWASPDRKIASIGIAAVDWITYHGLSLNVNVELDYFSMIRLCGFKDVRATSMKDILRKSVNMRQVKTEIIKSLVKFLDIKDTDHENFPALD